MADKLSTSTDASFISKFFSSSECDDINTPPSLNIVLRSLQKLPSGSDIRGRFVDHSRVGSIANVAHAIGKAEPGIPPLTPMAAQCIGYGFAKLAHEKSMKKEIVVCIGRDPRSHGSRLCDAFARGAQSVDGVRVLYTGVATTPSMFSFCRSGACDGGVMVTASHLPPDRNGFKFFTTDGGFSKQDVQRVVELGQQHARFWYDTGIMPPTSGDGAVYCAEWVDFMPQYAATLREAIEKETSGDNMPLAGLRIVLNAGNGSGGFFSKILEDLGADVSASMHLEPNADFPAGVPNPEYAPMIEETVRVCEENHADIGIMLDTDADRCGFVVPRTVREDGARANYEPLNRNRLIALLGVLFRDTGCTFVTDSVTSEGLATFLEKDVGLFHVRYLKGYANVIEKARELTESGINAEVAIETSGHCAMKENGYLDDGTYTAVKVIGLLARVPKGGLLDLISGLREMPEVTELRMKVLDGSLESTASIFDFAALGMEGLLEGSEWSIDRENLEGIRVRTDQNGGFFMLRKSLHDPILSMQIEGHSVENVRQRVVAPLLKLFESEARIRDTLDLSVLHQY